MTGQDAARPDLAAVLHPLTQALIDAELPVLATHGLTMWGYVVLNALDGGPVRTQAALAEQISADKTRIISTLDRLQAAGLISRQPDPDDRRVRLLEITPAGQARRAAVQAGIQANEEHLLALLPASGRQGFLQALRVYAGLSRAELTSTLQAGAADQAGSAGSTSTGSPTAIRPGATTEP